MPRPDSSTSPAHVRTRKGCLTCRKRRRKCDEQKPRCQNCTARNLHCRYGVLLTFLDTNSFELVPEHAQALQETTPSRYRRIKFVDGLDETERAAGDDDDGPHDSRPSLTFATSPPTVPETPDGDDSQPVQSVPDSNESLVSQPQSRFQDQYYHDGDSGDIDQRNPGESCNDDDRHHLSPIQYQSVLNHSPGIVIIDTEENVPLTDRADYDRHILERLSSQGSYPVVLPRPNPSTGTDHNNWLPSLSTIPETFMSAVRKEKLSHQYHVANNRRNELLKFYIDEVAPWLDICTPQSSFGIHIPILAKAYPPLLHAILALAAQQQSIFAPDNSRVSEVVDLARLAIASIRPDMYSNREEALSACTLLMVHDLLSTEIQHWRVVLKDRINFLRPLGIDGFSAGHCGSASWMTLRFDLALAILSEVAPMTVTEKWHPVSMSYSDDMGIVTLEKSKAPEWTRQSILLCSQAAQLCFSAGSSNFSPPHSNTDTWTYLWSSMRLWLESLPSSMHPVFTSPISAIPSAPPYFFPLILYTSRSNMHAAVMYHTTSELLLQSRPTNTRSSMHLKTPTWHAVQICGICIGNNTQWSNDPAILAALIRSGRLISYHEQRKELLDFLHVVVKASGWRVGGVIDDMIECWRVDSES